MYTSTLLLVQQEHHTCGSISGGLLALFRVQITCATMLRAIAHACSLLLSSCALQFRCQAQRDTDRSEQQWAPNAPPIRLPPRMPPPPPPPPPRRSQVPHARGSLPSGKRVVVHAVRLDVHHPTMSGTQGHVLCCPSKSLGNMRCAACRASWAPLVAGGRCWPSCSGAQRWCHPSSDVRIRSHAQQSTVALCCTLPIATQTIATLRSFQVARHHCSKPLRVAYVLCRRRPLGCHHEGGHHSCHNAKRQPGGCVHR